MSSQNGSWGYRLGEPCFAPVNQPQTAQPSAPEVPAGSWRNWVIVPANGQYSFPPAGYNNGPQGIDNGTAKQPPTIPTIPGWAILAALGALLWWANRD